MPTTYEVAIIYTQRLAAAKGLAVSKAELQARFPSAGDLETACLMIDLMPDPLHSVEEKAGGFTVTGLGQRCVELEGQGHGTAIVRAYDGDCGEYQPVTGLLYGGVDYFVDLMTDSDGEDEEGID